MLQAILAAGAFDPEAATQAYLNTLQGAARAKSDAYFEGGYWLLLWGTLVTIAVSWAELHFGWSAKWSAWAGRIAKRPALRAGHNPLPEVVVPAQLPHPWTN